KNLHPKEAKQKLAGMMVSRFHSGEAAESAARDFDKRISKSEFPEDAPLLETDMGTVATALAGTSLVKSRSELRRLIDQGAVELDGTVVKKDAELKKGQIHKIRIGKTRFTRLKRKDKPD
ncbi:MAG TPA: S4 domain-containing protein, partial [Nitrospiria bacterium]